MHTKVGHLRSRWWINVRNYNGTSLQAIRDFLGHKSEEMTKQYVDYLPDKIDKANEKYFSKNENSIAKAVRKGGGNGNEN